jgi:hypothetical protein
MAAAARRACGFLLALGAVASAVTLDAQYFGRNKVQYHSFQFEILKTDHFDLYHYAEEAEAARLAARLAERWYARLSRFFNHELRGRQPVILYAASAHFRQTNAIEGLIGEGTGGVTEALKRRVVLPMSGSLAETDHVLGHELVHAFQFDLTGADPRESMATAPDILQFPLWFAEGMAEYLTLGGVDAQTAMWMRDAAMREKLPHIRDLDDPRYFPYRWGHAFWAFIGAKYGDRTVASLLRSAANPRSDLDGLARQLGTDPDALTADWHAAITKTAESVLSDRPAITSEARRVVSRTNGGGRFNIGPRVSPDGREIAFFSERDRFSIELYVADAESGRVLRKLSSSATDPHFDSLEFLNSAGAWSPDGQTLAVGAIKGGKPILAMLDARSGRVRREWPLAGLADVLGPAFAPDGRSVVFSGNRGGLMDLYRLSLETGTLDRLTSDPFADLEPAFTPDGRGLVFVTERYSTNLDTLESGPLRLARIDLATREVRPIPGFLRGKHLSPQVTPDGRAVTFIADPDGISNLYRIPVDGGPIVKLSSVVTGVAGITASSPALSSSTAGRLTYSVFEDDGHTVYVLDESQVVEHVAPIATERAAVIPGRDAPSGDVERLLADPRRGLPPATQRPESVRYGGGLSLDAIGQPVVSAGVSEWGTFVGGGVSAMFTDMLGDRLLGVAGQAGGTLADLGVELVYLNRRHRWNWAASLQAIPYRVGGLIMEDDPAAGTVRLSEVLDRQSSRGASAMAAYPFSASTRLEVGGGMRTLTFSRQTLTKTFDARTGNLIDGGEIVTERRPSLHLAESRIALVRDTSFFGATSPVFGGRSRIELGQSAGTLQYSSFLADYRRYFMPRRPVTVAVRGMHFGRYGRDSENFQIVDLFVGYQELVRGYGIGSFDVRDCADRETGGACTMFNNLRGSRVGVANIEVRAPLPGLFRGEIEYWRVPIEIAGFFDAGLAWTRTSKPSFAGGTREIVRSAGAAVRANLLGFIVLELSAARPLDRPQHGWQWQLGIKQGF